MFLSCLPNIEGLATPLRMGTQKLSTKIDTRVLEMIEHDTLAQQVKKYYYIAICLKIKVLQWAVLRLKLRCNTASFVGQLPAFTNKCMSTLALPQALKQK